MKTQYCLSFYPVLFLILYWKYIDIVLHFHALGPIKILD